MITKKLNCLLICAAMSVFVTACGSQNTAVAPTLGSRDAWSEVPKSAKIVLDPVLTRKNIYVVLDGSQSMTGSECSGSESKTTVAKRAVKKFAQLVPAEDNLGLLVFDNQGITERVSLAINNRNKFAEAVDAAGADSGTPLENAIKAAYQKIKEQSQRQLGYGEYHLVVVTDGEANPGQDPREIVNKILAESPVVVHTIGFCIGSNHSLNQPGRTIYKEANNPQDLEEGLQSVLAESEKF